METPDASESGIEKSDAGTPPATETPKDGGSEPVVDAGNPPVVVDAGSIEIPGWKLVFNDEFNGSALDPAKRWDVYSGDQSNAPTQSRFDPKNVTVSNGQLHLTVEKRTGFARPYACGGLEMPHDLSQTSGRWVVRAKFPRGYGYVGYIGLFGPGEGAKYAEIDFAEVGGNNPSVNTFTQHYGNNGQDAHPWTAADSTADFHEYTVIWEEGQLTWLVDGVQQFKTSQKFSMQDMGLAMGDWASDMSNPWFGWPNATTPAVSSMDIDYVRVYKR